MSERNTAVGLRRCTPASEGRSPSSHPRSQAGESACPTGGHAAEPPPPERTARNPCHLPAWRSSCAPAVIPSSPPSSPSFFSSPSSLRSVRRRRADPDALARDSWIVTLSADASPVPMPPGSPALPGGRVGQVYTHALNGFQFRGSAQAAAALARNPHVTAVQADSPLPDGDPALRHRAGPCLWARWHHGRLPGRVPRQRRAHRGPRHRHRPRSPGAGRLDRWRIGKNCITVGAAPNDGHGHGTPRVRYRGRADQRRRAWRASRRRRGWSR